MSLLGVAARRLAAQSARRANAVPTLSSAAGTIRNESNSAPGLGYEHNKVGHLPKFKPQDNSTGIYDAAVHAQAEWSNERIHAAIKDNSVYSWGASDVLRKQTPLAKGAEGVYIIDEAGNKILDWSAGAVCSNLGHTMPKTIKDAAIAQMNKLPFVYGDLYTHEPRARLCALLGEISPADLNGFMFASGGAEANETAIRLARRYTNRPKIMSRYRSYHGGSTSALAMTGDPRTWAVNPGVSGFVKIMDPFPFTFDWGTNEEERVARSLGALHDQILCEGPDQIAAIVLESITGANGWMLTPTAYMQGVRALCDKYGILMICDEVMTGFGRTGKMFGFQNFEGVVPDMCVRWFVYAFVCVCACACVDVRVRACLCVPVCVSVRVYSLAPSLRRLSPCLHCRYTFAKGVTAAYVPLSGVGMRDHLFDHFRVNTVGIGTTYFAHPLACAMGYATLKYILETNLVQHVKDVEPVMQKGLAKLVANHPSVKSARTTGLGGGFDLAGKDGNFLMYMHEAHAGVGLLKKTMLENKLVTLIRGHHVHCTPPLIISAEQVGLVLCVGGGGERGRW
jgi:taurine--2-oxoglutarate transaminase